MQKFISSLKNLPSHNASIYVTDFSFIEPKENDFVYFDPPYYQAGERFYTRLPFDTCLRDKYEQELCFKVGGYAVCGAKVYILVTGYTLSFCRFYHLGHS